MIRLPAELVERRRVEGERPGHTQSLKPHDSKDVSIHGFPEVDISRLGWKFVYFQLANFKAVYFVAILLKSKQNPALMDFGALYSCQPIFYISMVLIEGFAAGKGPSCTVLLPSLTIS